MESPPRLWTHSKYKISKRKTKRYQKAKNVIFRSVRFADWFAEFKRYSKFAPKTILKINWSVKTHGYECMEVASSGSYGLLVWQVVFNQRFVNDQFVSDKLSKCLYIHSYTHLLTSSALNEYLLVLKFQKPRSHRMSLTPRNAIEYWSMTTISVTKST